MGLDRNTTLTHVYGVSATVISVVGGVALFTEAATWRDYLLYGSGWASALILGVLLSRGAEQGREDGIELGSLRSQVASLQATLEQRSAVLDYFGGQMMGARATPRTVINDDGEEQR
jgi:hypothetical protein